MKKLSMPGGMNMAERRGAEQPGKKLKDGKSAAECMTLRPSGKARKKSAK